MRNQDGLTIIELMVTLVVMVVTLSIGVPASMAMINNSRSTTLINQLVGDLNLARSEAVKRQSFVTLCIRDGLACVDPGDGANNWENGWIVWADADNDAALDAGEEILVREGFPTGWNFSGSGFATQGLLSFNGSGRQGQIVEAAGEVTFNPESTGTFILCDESDGDARFKRALIVVPMGYIRQPRDSNENGILEDHANNSLTNASCT